MSTGEHFTQSEAETRAIAATLSHEVGAGEVILLDGPLGAGKTTFVRGFLQGLGFVQTVRSPTFNLIQTFETSPPVMHADLYRVASHQGIGLEEYLDSHICLIEWPDRALGLFDPITCWRVHLHFANGGRRLQLLRPDQR